jgi:hypothetical protein
VGAFSRAAASAICIQVTLGLLVATPPAAAQQPQPNDLPVSLERIRDELEVAVPSRLKLDMPVEKPVPRFRTRVDQTVYVLTFDEWLDKEFNLIGIQRQSADWASKCCGIGLDPLLKSVENALQRRKERKIREQIARELAELETARKTAGLAGER